VYVIQSRLPSTRSEEAWDNRGRVATIVQTPCTVAPLYVHKMLVPYTTSQAFPPKEKKAYPS